MDPIDVLAVDDDKLVQKIIRRALEPNGYEVRTANDGESGLQEAIARPPQVLLLDVEMPGLTGYQVCEQLAERPEYQHIPIVFLSSHSSLHERMLGYEMGADDYIVKPFEAEDLLARIGVLLRYANQQRELHLQINQAKRTAIEALNTTSELGQAMSFMEKSVNFRTLDEAATGLLEVTDNLALNCRLMISYSEETHWYPSENDVSPLEKELIEMSDQQQRFHDFGASTLVNFPACSLLVTNMPLEDPERYGRIKDLIPLLLSGLSSKVFAIATLDALKDHTQNLTHSLSSIRGSLYRLGTSVLDNRRASSESLQGMIHNLQDDLLRMGLAEDEEQYLIDRIDASAEDAIEKMDSGSQLGNSFSFVHHHLKQVNDQQRALADAFEEIIAKQSQITQAASGDIELF